MIGLNKFATHKMSWYKRTFLLPMKSKSISKLFLVPMKRMKYQNNFATHKVLRYPRTILELLKSNEIQDVFCYL